MDMENVERDFSDSEWLLKCKLDPFDWEIDSGAGLCFLSKIENDLQRIFDHLCSKFSNKDSNIRCRNILRKGNIFHKGDFFLSLRSNRVFFISGVKEELLNKLKAIPYILESLIDDSGNLILCLNRTVLFKNVIKDVMRYERNYGIKASNKSYLILVHNEVFNDFDALRLALVANHVISFLTATGAEVSVNEFRKNPDFCFKEVPIYTCTDICLQEIKFTCDLIENSASSSGLNGNKWISICDQEIINVDLKKYAKVCSLSYGKDADDISILRNKPNVVLNQGAYTLHFNFHHGIKPDLIIHICLQNEKSKIIESGILIEMLQLTDAPQFYITCQNTHSKIEPEVTVGEYINFQKREIENAMKEKYSGHHKLKNEKCEIYFKNLVDTSLKFSFLRAGTNDPLKLDLSFNQKVTTKNKDGIFIQYNFARLSNILKNFALKVEEGYYKELPSLDKIDFELLKFEEEWNLLNFVLSFPRLVQEIFSSLDSKCFFPVNKVQIMLTELCHCFSKYYSRIHILSGPQPQLQKVMHARLWLLKGVLQILHNSFILLNIEGLNEM